MTMPFRLALREELWKRKCERNRRWPLERQGRAPANYVARRTNTELSCPGRPELMVVVMTYGRPKACARLVAELRKALQAADQDNAFVLVQNDVSSSDYAPVLDVLARDFAGRFAFLETSQRLGKQGFWFAYQHAFDMIEKLRAAHVMFLQDDVTFEARFAREALSLWKRIEDPTKIALYLMRANDDEQDGRWIDFTREPSAQGPWHKTQWLDLQAFLVGGRFFETLGWEVFPAAKSRWLRDPTRSSGVGEQFTRRLFERASIYQVDESLVFHGELPSLMNPEARALRPLKNS